MPTKRATLAAVALNGVVYAIGGGTFTGTPLTTVEAYDPASDTWSTKAPLPTAVDSMSATVDNGLIYVVGGFINGNGTPFNGAQTYNPTTNAWTTRCTAKPSEIIFLHRYRWLRNRRGGGLSRLGSDYG